MGTWESTHVHFWHEYEKFHTCRFWCYFTGTSFRMYISYNNHKRCTKETFLEGSAVYVNLFSVLGSTPPGTIDINLRSCVLNRHKLRQSQIATLPSQFVICRNLWSKPWRRKLSPTTLKTCSVYLAPMFTFDMNIKTYIFAHSGVISLVYLFVCMHISYKAYNRCTKETFLIGSDVDVNIFSALKSLPSGTIDINLKSCVLNRHKLRQSQIATLLLQFVICRNLWSKPWRRKLSPTTLKTCSVYLGEYPCSLLTWIWKLTFLPILVLFHWYICLCVCISAIKPKSDVQRKPSW